MEYISIEKIKANENVRKDYGDLTELTASIKEHGVRKPLELNSMNELVDGFRRLKAAKVAGLTQVPFFYNENSIDNTTEQILSGIFGKNLNVVEEGHAFVKYMASEKINIKDFAKKISKSEAYVQKRIEIVTLPKEITDEIVSGKLEIGHALLLKKMPQKEAEKYAKEIIKDKMSVSEALSRVQYNGGGQLKDAPFNKDACKGCQFNGAEQAELFETGKVLNGTCMNKKCYAEKMKQYVDALKEKYKDVLVDKVPSGYVRSDSYDAKDKGITEAYMKKCRESKENYCVQIETNYGVRVYEYFRAQPKKESEKTETVQAEVREQKLETRVNEFKIRFLIEKCRETITPGTKEAKALAMIEMNPGIQVKKAFEMTEKEIDKEIAANSIHALNGMSMKDLILATSENGVDIKKQFVITEEFLKMHTKDQLISLIKEFKIYVNSDDPAVKTIDNSAIKKEELIKHILDQHLKGKIPKILN